MAGGKEGTEKMGKVKKRRKESFRKKGREIKKEWQEKLK